MKFLYEKASFVFGLMLGMLSREAFVEKLKARGVKEETIMTLKKSLIEVSEIFYMDDE